MSSSVPTTFDSCLTLDPSGSLLVFETLRFEVGLEGRSVPDFLLSHVVGFGWSEKQLLRVESTRTHK